MDHREIACYYFLPVNQYYFYGKAILFLLIIQIPILFYQRTLRVKVRFITFSFINI